MYRYLNENSNMIIISLLFIIVVALCYVFYQLYEQNNELDSTKKKIKKLYKTQQMLIRHRNNELRKKRLERTEIVEDHDEENDEMQVAGEIDNDSYMDPSS